MKKLMLAFVLLLGVVVSVKAQSIYGDKVKTDVKMKYIYSFEEALKKAREVNKPIFVNCFADWAVPCHGMNQLVFSDQQFADWMDRHFVNLFIDITTNEGRPLAAIPKPFLPKNHPSRHARYQPKPNHANGPLYCIGSGRKFDLPDCWRASVTGISGIACEGPGSENYTAGNEPAL